MPNETYWARLKRAYNIFGKNKDPAGFAEIPHQNQNFGPSLYDRSDRPEKVAYGDRTIINSVYNRIAIEVAMNDIKHVRVNDSTGKFEGVINDELHDIFQREANIDQNAFQFKLDLCLTMLENGVAAIVPENTNGDVFNDMNFTVLTCRVARVVQYFPEYVKCRVFRQSTQTYEQVILPKKAVCLVENPLYSVMNGPNSTLARLVSVMSTMDYLNNKSKYGKLDMIVQLPYTIKSESRVNQAKKRKQLLEEQLEDSKYGIGYIDATEKITQLNRPADNNLMAQYESLMKTLYSQLGMTEEVINGTASDVVMNNFYQRTILPILESATLEVTRKWISRTGYTQGQRVMHFVDPFKYVTIGNLGDLIDKLSRNEVLDANEIRTSLGFQASSDPGADELRNKNIRPSPYEQAEETEYEEAGDGYPTEEYPMNEGDDFDVSQIRL